MPSSALSYTSWCLYKIYLLHCAQYTILRYSTANYSIGQYRTIFGQTRDRQRERNIPPFPSSPLPPSPRGRLDKEVAPPPLSAVRGTPGDPSPGCPHASHRIQWLWGNHSHRTTRKKGCIFKYRADYKQGERPWLQAHVISENVYCQLTQGKCFIAKQEKNK